MHNSANRMLGEKLHFRFDRSDISYPRMLVLSEQLPRRLCLILHPTSMQDEHPRRRARLQVDIRTLCTLVSTPSKHTQLPVEEDSERITYADFTKVPSQHIPVRRIAVLVPRHRIFAFVEGEVGI